MTRWCFKCAKVTDSPGDACPTCGSRFAVIHPGRAEDEPRSTSGHPGFIEESELTAELSRKYGVPSIHLDDFDIEPDTIALVGRDLAVKHRVIPVNRAGRSIIVAIADPSDGAAIRAVRDVSGLNAEVTVASEQAVARALGRYYQVPTERE